MANTNRVRVTRTLVYEGPYDRIKMVLDKGLAPDETHIFNDLIIRSTIVGIPQPVPEPTPKTDAVVAVLEKSKETP
jgi:hypothetical protein